MMKQLTSLLQVILCLGMLLPLPAIGQITVGSTSRTFSSLNPKNAKDAKMGTTGSDVQELNAMMLYYSVDGVAGYRNGGIYADNFGPGGKIELNVYLYNPMVTDGKGPKLYSCYSDHNSSSSLDYVEQARVIQIENPLDSMSLINVSESNMLMRLSSMQIYDPRACRAYKEKNTGNIIDVRRASSSLIALLKGGTACIKGARSVGYYFRGRYKIPAMVGGCIVNAIASSLFNKKLIGDFSLSDLEDKDEIECIETDSPFIKTIVEVTVTNATLKGIRLPCNKTNLTFSDLNNYFGSDDFQFKLLVNGTERINVNTADSNAEEILANVSLKLGDDVSIEYKSSLDNAPDIAGVPSVWPAAFAGDMMFHCNPNVQPGGPRPFIGYDSRVHTLMMRSRPSTQSELYPSWQKDMVQGLPRYRWSWTADRVMDGNVTKYTPSLTWPKCHLATTTNSDGSLTYLTRTGEGVASYTCKNMGTDSAPVYQRQDQKEGLNIQYLTYSNNWPWEPNVQGYDGVTKFMKGFDDDELAYFNTKYPKVTEDPNKSALTPCTTPGCQQSAGITKLEKLLWKTMPEGKDQNYNDYTGFPESGFAINDVVNAQRKFVLNKNFNAQASGRLYAGYEIQDRNTDWDHPDGNGPNVMHPGVIRIGGGSKTIVITMNVSSPLDSESIREIPRSLGFYEALVGESTPSYGETGVRYWLRGVANKTDAEKAKYTLVYSSMDRLGNITETSYSVKDQILTPYSTSGETSWQQWVNKKGTGGINLDKPAYGWLTAYYQRTSTSQKVPVAGKELSGIFLLFCGIEKMNGQAFPEGPGQGTGISGRVQASFRWRFYNCSPVWIFDQIH
ncbi:hypothetical protein ACFFJX_04905 [Pseudarcicella hirudinis]|uniref:hypothetical protein n=1 Tax=Pseudarcicella hirudinis TaxID=1079859 RepID=UPI0035E836D2